MKRLFSGSLVFIYLIVMVLSFTVFTQSSVVYAASDPAQINLAQNKPASAYSTFADANGLYKPEYATDGILYNNSYLNSWAWDNTCASDNGKTWWQVDLLGKTNISTVKISYRGYNNIFGQIPKSITFQVSDDGQNWTTIISKSPNVPVEGSTYSSTPFSYTLSAQGRYLRLLFEELGQNQSNKAIILHEVEVYGQMDIAMYKPVNAYSTCNSSLYRPDFATDGLRYKSDYLNSWAWDNTCSSDNGKTWWQVDFQGRATIATVMISFRGYNNIFGQIPKSITFQMSDDGQNWTTVVSKSTNVPSEGSTYSATPYSYSLNARGRYLRLLFEELGQNQSNQAIILHEVEVYGEVNVAYNKTATAFSTVNDPLYSPACAVDGIGYTVSDLHSWAWDNSCASDNGKTWWQVDLGAVSNMDGVKISFRGYNNVFGQIPKSITFQVSYDGQNWRTIIDKSANVPVEGSVYTPQPYSYTLHTQGRYLRLLFEELGQNQTNQAIILHEVEVYGELDLAYGKTASAFSTCNDPLYSPSSATDGLRYISSDLHSWAWDNTCASDNGKTWWQVDLGSASDMKSVKISYRGYNGFFGQIPKSITFQVSDDGITWKTMLSQSTNVPVEGSMYSATPYSYILNTHGRYLRLLFEELGQNQSNQAIILHEVEVYGKDFSYDNSIKSFGFNGLSPVVKGSINQTKSNIYLTVPYGTNLTGLVATFDNPIGSTVKVGTVIQQNGTTANDFTNPVTYTVISEDGTVRNYSVKVTVAAQIPITRQQRVDQWFSNAKVGAYVTWGLWTGGNTTDVLNYRSAAEFEAAANAAGWSADKMLAPVTASGAKYFVLASFHSGGGYIKPWPSQIPGSECTQRDFYGEVIDRAHQLGIKTLIYINCDPNLWTFRNGVWLYEANRTEKGWASYVFDVVDELMDKYGDKISGFWFDGGGDCYDNGRPQIWKDQGTLAYIHARFPNYIAVSNPGNEYSLFDGYDVMYGEFSDTTPSPSFNLPCAYSSSRPLSNDLCVELPNYISNDYIYWVGQNYTRNNLTAAIKQMVCVAGNKSRWNSNLIFGPMIDGSLPSNPNTQANEIGAFMAWAGESILNTIPGQFNNGYTGGFCNDGSYAVTTRNGNTHYIHVLIKPTSNNYISIPNNGIQAASVINLRTGASVSFTQNTNSITINNSTWDDIDTIFKVVQQ